MKERYIPSIVIIGWSMLLLGILLDDITTFILFGFGFRIAETNSLFLNVTGRIILILIYVFVGWVWYDFNTRAVKKHQTKEKGYKYYDVFVFMACFILVFMAINKVEAGINNINYMVDYINDKEKVISNLEKLTTFKETDPNAFSVMMINEYEKGVIYIHYLKAVLMVFITFLLFRTGFEVRPWGIK